MPDSSLEESSTVGLVVVVLFCEIREKTLGRRVREAGRENFVKRPSNEANLEQKN